MKTRGLFNTIMVTALSSVLLLQNGWMQAYALDKNAEINEENILEMLDTYDPDGAYIIHFSLDEGNDILIWFDNSEKIIDGVGTAVHEETHRYILQNHLAGEEEIYIGDGQSVHVTYTEVFDSSEMAAEVSSELQTFRFDNYVGNPDANMASDIDGIYGLLNEFTAYCWDLNNTVCLYDYYKAEANTDEDWLSYINQFDNGRMAYSEFNYYILNYLAYARENHPNVYEGIVSNDGFTEAYLIIENKYRSLIETAEQYIDEIVKEYNGEKDGNAIYFGSTGTALSEEDYVKLVNETSKAEYQEIYQTLGKNVLPTAGLTVTTSTNSGSSSQTTTSVAISTPYTYSNIISSIGSGEEEEKSWFTVSSIVLVTLWGTFLSGIIVIVIELIRGSKKK